VRISFRLASQSSALNSLSIDLLEGTVRSGAATDVGVSHRRLLAPSVSRAEPM